MITVDQKKCTGCGQCEIVCPHGIMKVSDGTAFVLDDDRCVTCGACGLNCPADAILVKQQTGCLVTIIKEDILKMKCDGQSCGNSNSDGQACG
ncbi:MAG: 4Fe-4S binding protein [Nitrospira sp.]|nr:4Fe-4S binding protein [bacterium]MBL7048353.1 4Fe-4S binding protein [Nitrospira sp.]